MPAMTGDDFLPSPDLLNEQSYLVARGVRPMAVVGQCSADELVMLRVATRLEEEADANSIPFVVDHHDGHASYGYAAARWALDLYEWAMSETDIPQAQRDRIVGLLLGYAVHAVSRF